LRNQRLPATSPPQFCPHRINHRLVILFAENRTAGDKSVSPGGGHVCDIVGFDAAIDFKADVLA